MVDLQFMFTAIIHFCQKKPTIMVVFLSGLAKEIEGTNLGNQNARFCSAN